MLPHPPLPLPSPPQVCRAEGELAAYGAVGNGGHGSKVCRVAVVEGFVGPHSRLGAGFMGCAVGACPGVARRACSPQLFGSWTALA